MDVTRERRSSPNLIVRRTPAGACLLTVDSSATVRRWTKDAEVVFGYARDSAEGMPVENLVPFLTDCSGALEGWCRRADGSVFRGLVATLGAVDGGIALAADGGPFQVFAITDITSRYVRAQAEVRVRERKTGGLAGVRRRGRLLDDRLRASEARVRLLERQVLDVSEQVQRRIGQDLHDGLGQLLTGTAFLTKGLQHSLALEYQPQAQRIVELINMAIARVRNLARGLSPIHIDAKSLEAVLQQTVSEASELLGVACELQLDQYVDSAPPAAIAQLCLIAREALTNAVRHGHAQHIVVKLSRAGDQSTLSVADDGVGIGAVDKPLEGLGLRSMRYRAEMIGGKLDILHTRRGTTVRCCWRDP